MVQHVLDRAIWHALTGRQAAFSVGSGKARRYASDVGLFAATEDDSDAALMDLAGLIPGDSHVVLLQAGPHVVPRGLEASLATEGVQMVLDRLPAFTRGSAVLALDDADAPDMLALALLTKPGPFLPRTHRLGAFVGIREEGRLVAMAGERIKLDGYSEVSGVCTHPEARGKGYARLLSLIVAERIQARGEVPFLHAFANNSAAIGLYETIGFRKRCDVSVTFLKRKTD